MIEIEEITVPDLQSELEAAPTLKAFLMELCDKYLEEGDTFDFKINFEMLANALGLV